MPENTKSAPILELASRNRRTNREMSSLFLPLQGAEGDGSAGGTVPGDKCAVATACTFCAGSTGEEKAGVLLIGVPCPPGGDAVNWGVVRKAGGDCSAGPITGDTCGDDSTPGGIIDGGRCDRF